MSTVLVDRMPWDQFAESWFPWQQGEHVVIVGPTGAGKSTLLRSILSLRDWVAVLCTKKRDRTYNAYLADGYVRTAKFPPPAPPRGQTTQHALLWPNIKTLSDVESLTPIFAHALDKAFEDGGWCLGLDDLYYLSKPLKLQAHIEKLNYQARSCGLSLVSCMQRPAWVPRACWDQASHAFIRRLNDVDDLRTIRGLSTVTGKRLEEITGNLQRYEWLYLPVARGDSQPPVIVRPPQ